METENELPFFEGHTGHLKGIFAVGPGLFLQEPWVCKCLLSKGYLAILL